MPQLRLRSTRLRFVWGLLLAVVLSSCSAQISIVEAVASGDGTRIDLALNSCGATHDIVIEENTETVTVTATSPDRPSGDDCLDGWSMKLAAPLGDRALIDGSTNAALDVRYEPWNQQRFSEAQYRTALERAVACILEADPEIDAAIVDGPDGPQLSVELGDLPDGQSREDPTNDCSATHLEPLRQ